MHAALLFVGTSLSSNGFRRIASLAREVAPETKICFVMISNNRSIPGILGLKPYTPALTTENIKDIAHAFKQVDILGISCMSLEAEQCKKIVAEIRHINPGVFVIWGGVHAIIAPEDLIEYADALCVNEGDMAFPELFRRLLNGENYLNIQNFWFRMREGYIVKNSMRPLTTPDELDELPPPLFFGGELIYRPKKGFTEVTVPDYLHVEGLSYSTVWIRGCPFKCTYCSNNNFLKIDRGFGYLRQPDIDTILKEVKTVLERHPYIQAVNFNDDCFMALSENVLEDFATKWQKQISLPFAVLGATPVHVTQKKVEILISGGMYRIRMGIQSGSDRILKQLKRANRQGLISEKTAVLAKFAKQIIPPSYDIIVDFPMETKEDVDQTLRMVYNIPRPFHLNIFSLRLIPNTELYQQLSQWEMSYIKITDSSYIDVVPTFANALLFYIAVFPMPKFLFEYCLYFTQSIEKSHTRFHWLMVPLKFFFYADRVFSHLKIKDFSLAFGYVGWRLWQLNILKKKIFSILESLKNYMVVKKHKVTGAMTKSS